MAAMRDDAHDGPILFAYDGSEQARAAIRQAGRQLNSGRDAIVLTVWQPFGALPFFGGERMAPELEHEVEQEAEKVAEQGAQLARSVGFDASARATSSLSIWRTIIDEARDRGASIVVMGSHGDTGIKAALMGSVATTVSRHADRPVMIVHPPR
jgi:nucleotide-binding universal stress UspA family protein